MRRYRVLHPRSQESAASARDTFALDVLMGLSSHPKSLPSRYFYDDAGSRLFTRITELPEYYPTACETAILREHGEEIARHAGGAPLRLVELGAGDGRKSGLLLDIFHRAGLEFSYVPIDISVGAMKSLTRALARTAPTIQVEGLVAEYFDGLRWLARESGTRMLVLFLGSNIGNFNAPGQRVFLRTLWNALSNDDLVLIGFDLKKDIDTLIAAYNDRAGVTAAFNLNMLTRINRELGGQFDIDRFRHFGTYNVFSGAMESYLLSLESQEVHIGAVNRSFSFGAWEPVHVEYSFKFLPSEVRRLAAETGFEPVAEFHDGLQYFTDALWCVRKAPASDKGC